MDVVIVHHHAASSAGEAVSALRQDARASGLAIDIIIVDNGSTAEERALLDALDVQRLDPGRNLGYAGAVNSAVPATISDAIVLMNEDVIVLPGCLRALHSALVSGASVAGPLFYWDRDCTFLLPCTEVRTRRNELLKIAARRSPRALRSARMEWREHARRHWLSRDPVASTSLSGALLAFRRDAWSAAGPFDEGFRLYFEENDWLLRVARAGLQCVYLPSANAIHLHDPRSAGRSERLAWEAESFLRFGNRYYGERFMRRLMLLSARQSALPAWSPLTAEGACRIPLVRAQDCAWPLWVELTPSPLGFPAAAARILDPETRSWTVPPMRGLHSLEGTLYLQIVDDSGRELSGYALEWKCGSEPAIAPNVTRAVRA